MPFDDPTLAAPASTAPSIHDEGRASLPIRYIELARQTLSDAGGCPDGFPLIVQSTLTALHLFFSAALHEPTEWELDVFFETFVRACVEPFCAGGQQ